MNREEYMEKLEYLLQDILEEEKEDALQYYRDYMEEAGPENEERVIREFGSPERVAALIRASISGNLESGGEFTESGYQDERFRDPNYQVARRLDLPEEKEQVNNNSADADRSSHSFHTSKALKVILWIILLVVAIPVVFGLAGGIGGVLAGIGAVLLALAAGLGIFTFCWLVAGVGVLGIGLVFLFTQTLNGLLLVGIGLLIFGSGLLFLALCGLFYGKFLPFLFRTVTDGINGIINRCRKHG